MGRVGKGLQYCVWSCCGLALLVTGLAIGGDDGCLGTSVMGSPVNVSGVPRGGSSVLNETTLVVCSTAHYGILEYQARRR